MYEQSLDIIKSGYQRSIKLEDIPGLFRNEESQVERYPKEEYQNYQGTWFYGGLRQGKKGS